MKKVWIVMDNVEPGELKVFKSKRKALKYYKKMCSSLENVDEEYEEEVGTKDEFRYTTTSTIVNKEFGEKEGMWMESYNFSDRRI